MNRPGLDLDTIAFLGVIAGLLVMVASFALLLMSSARSGPTRRALVGLAVGFGVALVCGVGMVAVPALGL